MENLSEHLCSVHEDSFGAISERALRQTCRLWLCEIDKNLVAEFWTLGFQHECTAVKIPVIITEKITVSLLQTYAL